MTFQPCQNKQITPHEHSIIEILILVLFLFFGLLKEFPINSSVSIIAFVLTMFYFERKRL